MPSLIFLQPKAKRTPEKMHSLFLSFFFEFQTRSFHNMYSVFQKITNGNRYIFDITWYVALIFYLDSGLLALLWSCSFALTYICFVFQWRAWRDWRSMDCLVVWLLVYQTTYARKYLVTEYCYCFHFIFLYYEYVLCRCVIFLAYILDKIIKYCKRECVFLSVSRFI